MQAKGVKTDMRWSTVLGSFFLVSHRYCCLLVAIGVAVAITIEFPAQTEAKQTSANTAN